MRTIFLLFLQTVFTGFAQHTKANAPRLCPKLSSCIDSYADIYKSLASEENSFNIESALFPALKPSSLVVKVEFITNNETSVANYTWSVNCLYVAIPPEVLQLLSFGSILVTPRTQELKICIPYFCRNFSSTKEQRGAMKDVLAALQDLAVIPEKRDPRLNTAECVIEEHHTDIAATGRSSYIRAMLWCAFIFSFWAGPYVAEVILGVLEQRFEGANAKSLFCWCKCVPERSQSSQSQTSTAGTELLSSQDPQQVSSPHPGENARVENQERVLCCQVCSKPQQDPFVSSFVSLCHILFCIDVVILVFVFIFSKSGNAPIEIYITLVPLILEGIVITLLEKFPSCIRCNLYIKIVIRFSVTLTVYHFCWLVIGIMINPIWGLAVCLIACFFVVALTFILFQLFKVEDCQWSLRLIKHIIICIGTFCGGCSFVALAVLAGQSFYGRETADELMKTVLLYVISGFISWLSWKGRN